MEYSRGMLKDSFIARFSTTIGARGLRLVGKLNVPAYRLSGGRIGGRIGKGPVLLLTTTGRKSGERRTAPVLHLAHRVWLDVKPDNGRARRLYASLGFEEEGVLRDALRTEAGYESLILMAKLRPPVMGERGFEPL